MRQAIESAILERCNYKNWALQALNVRTNHVHAVVTAENESPETVLQHLKAWSTRRLRECALTADDSRVWARHGSTRMVWSDADLAERVDYVLYQQGAPLT